MASLVEQGNQHVPLLSVLETFQFASSCADSAALTAEGVSDELRAVMAAKPEMVTRMLGLDECRDTFVGNDMVRGVSGGQKRRCTVGEMLLTDSRVLCGDEITNGLDAAVAVDVVSGIRDFTKSRAMTTVVALQQPTPELLELFDEICLLSEGHVVFKGPLGDLEPYLNARGFHCPPASDLADWLIEVVTDPSLARAHEAEAAEPGAGTAAPAAAAAARASGAGGKPIASSASTDSDASDPLSTVEGLAAEWIRSAASVEQLDSDIGDLDRFPTVAEALTKPTPFALAKFGVGVGTSLWSQLHRTMARQVKLVLRNPVLIQARFFATILNCAVFGTLFWQPDEDQFGLRAGIVLFILIYLSFSNLSELPVVFEARRTAYKHIYGGFYTELPYIMSVWIVHLPIAIINSLIASSMIYWFVGFTNDAPSFLFFVLATILTEITMSSWFRLVSYTASTEELANTIGGSSTGIFLLFSGFLLTRLKLPVGALFLYYISPFAWVVRSVLLSEFGNDRYQDLLERPVDPLQYQVPPMIPQRDAMGNIVLNLTATPPSPVLVPAFPVNTVPVLENVTERVAYLEAFEFFTDDVWRWAGIGVMAAYAILFGIVLATCSLRFCKHDSSIGTRRQPKDGAVSAVRRSRKSAPGASVSSSFPFSKATLAFHDLRYTVFVDPAVKENADALAGGSDKGMLSPAGLLIELPVEKQGPKVGLALLRNIHGVASPGRMIALMGASGAGKTTLMDCLCGRKSQGIVDGTIAINGSKLSPSGLAQAIAYVEQTDLHFPEATVREALLFSARLRLPSAVSSAQREAFVDENLALLEMTGLCDRPVRTLAPAELKLTTIGVELCANPAVLALDEPTTGLDARSAAVVMRVMRNIANTGRTILATIHQPSSSIFLSFDDLLLLERGGRQVYFGELGHLASTFVAFLEAVPGVRKLPVRTNPATWMLEEVARFQDSQIAAAEANDAEHGETNPKAVGEADAKAEPPDGADVVAVKRAKSLARVYSTSVLRTRNAEISEKVASGAHFEVSNPIGSTKAVTVVPKPSTTIAAAADEAKPGFITRVGVVSWRVLEDYWRNTEYNASRVITLVVLAVVFGLAFLGIDTTKDEAGVRSAISVLYTAAGFGGTISFSSLLPALGKRRAAYYREKSVGMYPPATYYIALMLIEAVYVGVMLFAFVPILYFLVGLRPDVTTFFETYIIVWLVALWFIAFAQFFVALMPSIVVAQIVSGAILLTQTNLFSGVFLPPADIPAVYSWIYAINPTGLATRGLALVQFHTPTGEDPTIIEAFVDGRFQAVDRQVWVESFVDAKYEDRWDVMWQIALIALVVEILAIVFLTFINHSKR